MMNNFEGMSRVEIMELMREARTAARLALANAIDEEPKTADELSAKSGQAFYTDTGRGVGLGMHEAHERCAFPYNASRWPDAKFIRGERTIVRYFAEIDENGDLIEDGATMTKTKKVATYSLNPYYTNKENC